MSKVRGPTLNTNQKKFNSRPVAPTFFRNEPFGENVEGLFHCGNKSYGSMSVFKRSLASSESGRGEV